MQKLQEITSKLSQSITGEPSTARVMTTGTGCPIGDPIHSLSAGPTGPVVVTDVHLLDKVLAFNREKIPARNVHALGCGAYGQLTITNDITKFTKADLFSSIGKTTPLFTRFSGIFTEQGDADTTRDPRGFALKFYTKEGNWDLMGINTPVFAVRDMKVGPDAVHAFKRDPRNGCWNPTQTWDYVATHPEGLHQVAMIYTDRTGTPASYRRMNGYGCHTFSLINANNERFWVKFHIKCIQGAAGLTSEQAKLLAGQDPNWLSKDLWESIENGNYPKWKLMMQVMDEQEGYAKPFTFDPTKSWKQSEYPLIEIGTIEVNRNPIDYFSEVEQACFQPTNMVPGIGLSPDRLLNGRLLVYAETQHHRVGAHYNQLQVNQPQGTRANTNFCGGQMNTEVKDKFPHYFPSNFGGLDINTKSLEPPLKVDGPVGYFPLPYEGTDEDYYDQVRDFWNDCLSDMDRDHLAENIASSFFFIRDKQTVTIMLQHFEKVDVMWRRLVEEKLHAKKSGKQNELEMAWTKLKEILNK